MICERFSRPGIVETNALNKTIRGTKGFGSTGGFTGVSEERECSNVDGANKKQKVQCMICLKVDNWIEIGRNSVVQCYCNKYALADHHRSVHLKERYFCKFIGCDRSYSTRTGRYI